MKKQVSVVITTLNNYYELWFTVQSVISMLKGYEFEIIISDNGSDISPLTMTETMVKNISNYYDIKLVVFDKIKSCPGTRTAGIMQAKYDLVCFMDGHVILEKDYFDSMIPLFDDPDVYVVFAPEAYYAQKLWEYTVTHQLNFQQSTSTYVPQKNEPYPVLASCQAATMMRKDLLKFFFPEEELNYIPYSMDEPYTPMLAWMFGKKVLMNPKTYFTHRPWGYTPGGNCDYERYRPLGAYAVAGEEWYKKAKEFWHTDDKYPEELILPQKHRDFIEQNAVVKFKDLRDHLVKNNVKI